MSAFSMQIWVHTTTRKMVHICCYNNNAIVERYVEARASLSVRKCSLNYTFPMRTINYDAQKTEHGSKWSAKDKRRVIRWKVGEKTHDMEEKRTKWNYTSVSNAESLSRERARTYTWTKPRGRDDRAMHFYQRFFTLHCIGNKYSLFILLQHNELVISNGMHVL